MADLRKILEKFSLLEGQNAQQKSVPQLPADFNAGDISPVLGAKEKAHPTHDYFVGEEDASHNGLSPDTKQILEGFGDSPVAQAIANRIMRQFPEMITDYGIEHLMHAIEQQAEMVGDVEEIGSSDVGGWIRNIKRELDRELTKEGLGKTIKRGIQGWYGDDTGPNGENLGDPRDVVRRNKSHDDETLQLIAKSIAGEKKTKHSPGELQQRVIDREMRKRGLSEDVATEDVLSTVKKKLGDYLKNIEDEIKSDPDLKDKLDKDIDVVGPAVKTLTTDDGHEIKIHGNEDDGFRITIQNKPAKSTFKDLDEASMAVEMFNARRRRAAMPVQDDGVDDELDAQIKGRIDRHFAKQKSVEPRAALLQRLKQNNDYVDEK